MTSLMITTVSAFILIAEFPLRSHTYSDPEFSKTGLTKIKHLEKRSVPTFPPDSLLQINMGITLAEDLKTNSASIVLAFQQNAPLPNETESLLPLSHVVSARKFSIYDHLRDVMTSYGLNGSECLRKMICQIGEAPLLGGLVEDVINFVLSPSKHRSVRYSEPDKEKNILLESERLGKLGAQVSQKFEELPLKEILTTFVRRLKVMVAFLQSFRYMVHRITIYLALALPLDLPQYEISMSFNYEANYNLPTNATELALGPQFTEIRKARSLTREKLYSFIEDQLKNEGLLGKPCLLRTICETQANPVLGHNGLIGDLIHILFTPSTTSREDISNDYSQAEEEGLKGKENCARMYADCPVDLYDLFSVWSN